VNDVSSVCYVDDAGKFTDFDSRFALAYNLVLL
jgi:hypothetical protein